MFPASSEPPRPSPSLARTGARGGPPGSAGPLLRAQLDPKQPLYQLALKLPWNEIEESLRPFYPTKGRPAKSPRLMVALLLLKQMYDLSDEDVLSHWVQNPYWQFFSGLEVFQWHLPCDPSALSSFRARLGAEGMQVLLGISTQMLGRKAREKEVLVDTTVQPKNITFPTDSKLYRKVIARLWRLARQHQHRWRRSYVRTVATLKKSLRGGRSAQAIRLAKQATRRLRTIGGRLLRELAAKLGPAADSVLGQQLALCRRALAQRRQDKNKVYSLHEPSVYCISKGKEHKKYEFGCKVSLAVTKNSGVVVAALALSENQHDAKTLRETLAQVEANVGQRPAAAIVDRGYRGAGRQIEGTAIVLPDPSTARSGTPAAATDAAEVSARRKKKRQLRRRCAIEPRIGHLKSDFRLERNYLAGPLGDAVNVLLAAVASNLRKCMGADWRWPGKVAAAPA